MPAFLHPLPTDAPAEPARRWRGGWSTANSPTTARAFVNRVWQAYFGTGLVATSEDFGMQSEPPSHPELLDWLAVEFMERGWSLKHLHRLIVTSATYRQSSQVTPELLRRDPDNRLLARGPRFRVEGEVVRDIALAASGLLEPEGRRAERLPAGPGVPVPAAGQLRAEGVDGGRPAPDRYRRACTRSASARCRTRCCQTFDAPNGDFACVRRAAVEHAAAGADDAERAGLRGGARALGRRALREGGTTTRSG